MRDYSELSLNHIRFFIEIARAGTMRKAAETLYVSQPLLSKKLAQMEQIIGYPLFERQHQRIRITAAGAQLLRDLEDIQNQIQYAIDAARQLTDQPEKGDDVVTLSFTSGVADGMIDGVLHGLRDSFPDQSFEIDLSSMNQAQEHFADHDSDILLISDYDRLARHPDYSCRTAFMTHVCFLMYPACTLFKVPEPAWHDLNGRTVIIPSYLEDSMVISDFKKKLWQRGIRMDIRYRDSDFVSILKYIAVNDFMTLGPLQATQSKDIRYLPIQGMDYPFVIALHKDHDQKLDAYTERLYQLLRALHQIGDLAAFSLN